MLLVNDQYQAAEAVTAAIYTPLDTAGQEIRLLILEKGLEDDLICCNLKKASLLESRACGRPDYEAVSYVWGNVTLNSMIDVGGMPMLVTASAARVLRRFRFPDKNRILWLDAICINQADIRERSQQVSIMTEVYSHCSQVLIWLGDVTPHAHAAYESFCAVLSEAKITTDSWRRLNEALFDPDGHVRMLEMRMEENLQPAVGLFSAPWFGRLWVLQEAALAPKATMYAGSITLDFLDVLRTARWIWCRYGLTRDQIDTLRPVTRMWDYTDPDYGQYPSSLCSKCVEMRYAEMFMTLICTGSDRHM